MKHEHDLSEMFLRQQYAKRIIGYLTQLIVEYHKEKSKEKGMGSRKRPEIFGALQPLVDRIEKAFGDINIASGLMEHYKEPVIAKNELYSCVRGHEIPFRQNVFDIVVNDIIRQGIIIPDIVLAHGLRRENYIINTRILGSAELREKCVSIKDELEERIVKYIYDDAAKIILRFLVFNPESRIYSLGYLFSKIRENGVGYDDYMGSMGSLHKSRLLKIGNHASLGEVYFINPLLKPYDVIRAVCQKVQSADSEEHAKEGRIILLNPRQRDGSSLENIAKDGGAQIIYLFGGRD